MTRLHSGRRVTVDAIQQFLGKKIIVNYKTDDDPKIFEGKVLAISPAGLVMGNRSTTKLFDLEEVIDWDPVTRQRRVQRRQLRVLDETDQSVRQHLADRHAVPVDVLNAVDEDTARSMHDRIDHGQLGHYHVSKAEQDNALDRLGEPTDPDDDDGTMDDDDDLD